jgi:hypothetical protein
MARMDARVLAGTFLVSALALCVVGVAAVPDASFALTLESMVPLLLGAAGFLAMMLVVDPVLTPKHKPTRDEVHVWLSKTFVYRLPVLEAPALAGLLIVVVDKNSGALLLGALGTAMLAAVWWPGDQFFNAMRRRLQPLSADRLVDDVLGASNGHLMVRTR